MKPHSNPRFNVLIVCRSSPFHCMGGMEVIAWQTACALARSGSDVTYLTTVCDAIKIVKVVDGVQIIPLPVPAGVYSSQWWRATEDYFETNSSKIDSVLSISAGAMSIARRTRFRALRPRLVAQIHGTARSEFVSVFRTIKHGWRSFESLFRLNALGDLQYALFDDIIFTTSALFNDRRKFPNNLYFMGPEHHLLPNAVDEGAFAFDPVARQTNRSRLGIRNDELVVLVASRLHPQKGVDHALEEVAKATGAGRRVKLLIVGDGPEMSDLKTLARHLQLDGNTLFEGAVPHTRMPQYYSTADALLLPSRRQEWMTLSMLEAMANGLPVLASEHLFPADLRSLVAIDPQNPGAIARALDAFRPTNIWERTSYLPQEYSLEAFAGSYSNFARSTLQRSVATNLVSI